MTARHKWAIGLAVTASLLGTACLALAWWLPSDAELAEKLAAVAQQQLGVPVTIGAAHWALLPTPSIVISDAQTQQTPPAVIHHLSVYPSVSMLLRCKLVIEQIIIDDAVFPRKAVRTWHANSDANALDTHDLDPSEHDASDRPLVEHLTFHNLSWVSYNGIAVAYDGEVDFDAHWRPHRVDLRTSAASNTPFTLLATHEDPADDGSDRWQTQISVGGGTANGTVALNTASDGVMHLDGQLTPHGVEVASALASFNRQSPIAGKANGQTALTAHGTSLGQLTQSLHSQSHLTINPATVLHFDLDKAVSSRGKEHDGQTTLQELTGQLDTQNGDDGMRLSGSNIRARAGKYTITGDATLFHGQLEATGNLDLVEGALGVPFTLSGPVHKPTVTVPPGFYAGAAIGTVVLPGIGTAIGARIGGALGKLFGKESAKQKPAPLPAEHHP